MAELRTGVSEAGGRGWTAAQTRGQIAAVARLRWHMLKNMSARKGAKAELAGRIVLFTMLGLLGLMLIAAAGLLGFACGQSGRMDRTAWIFWVIFFLCQLMNINLGQPGTTFDPTELIRFPMPLRNYVAIRLFFNLLSPANVIGSLMSLAVVVGAAVAVPGLWGYGLAAAAAYAITIVLFSRMVFAWVDRWLSTRRAREVFTATVFLGSMGIQWLNFTFNPAYGRKGRHNSHVLAQRMHAMSGTWHLLGRWTADLPPSLAGRVLVAGQQGHTMQAAFLLAACMGFAALFLAVFALRMSREFRGEALSDSAASQPVVATARRSVSSLTALQAAPAPAEQTAVNRGWMGLPPAVGPLLQKEVLYVRRNSGMLYALVGPLIMVAILAGRWASRSSGEWVMPAALAYTLMGTAPLLSNAFGLEAAGAQFYFLAPVRLRDVFLAKNLLSFALTALETVAVLLVVGSLAALPPLLNVAGTLCWAAATLLLLTMLGNRRSVTAPKRIEVARAAGKQSSPTSALLAVAILLAAAAVGGGVLWGGWRMGWEWLTAAVFAPLALLLGWLYVRSLRSMEAFTYLHRESLLLELCKK